MDERILRLTRIRSTNEYLDLFVNLELLLRDLSTHSYWVQELENYLKCLNAIRNRPKKRLIVCLKGTRVGNNSGRYSSQEMQAMGTSLGWTVVRLTSMGVQLLNENTWLCLV